jgi:hypothetical protein
LPPSARTFIRRRLDDGSGGGAAQGGKHGGKDGGDEAVTEQHGAGRR